MRHSCGLQPMLGFVPALPKLGMLRKGMYKQYPVRHTVHRPALSFLEVCGCLQTISRAKQVQPSNRQHSWSPSAKLFSATTLNPFCRQIPIAPPWSYATTPLASPIGEERWAHLNPTAAQAARSSSPRGPRPKTRTPRTAEPPLTVPLTKRFLLLVATSFMIMLDPFCGSPHEFHSTVFAILRTCFVGHLSRIVHGPTIYNLCGRSKPANFLVPSRSPAPARVRFGADGERGIGVLSS